MDFESLFDFSYLSLFSLQKYLNLTWLWFFLKGNNIEYYYQYFKQRVIF